MRHFRPFSRLLRDEDILRLDESGEEFWLPLARPPAPFVPPFHKQAGSAAGQRDVFMLVYVEDDLVF